jgi:hypothetical protein
MNVSDLYFQETFELEYWKTEGKQPFSQQAFKRASITTGEEEETNGTSKAPREQLFVLDTTDICSRDCRG